MADSPRMCALLVLCAIGVSGGILTAKGFYCRDPDTGNLHALNTSWPSTTFCGSYTCKVKRRNITEEEYNEVKKINITKLNVNEIRNNDKSRSTAVPDNMKVEESKIIEKNTKPDFSRMLILNHKHTKHNPKTTDDVSSKEKNKTIALEKLRNIGMGEGLTDNDRYLNEQEIKSLTELLHAVKRSDLEAIVEIYNLAHEIYEEIDASNSNTLIEETIKDVKQGTLNKYNKNANNNQVSYWYDPMSIANIKPNLVEAERNKLQSSLLSKSHIKVIDKKVEDMHLATTKSVQAAVPKTKTITHFKVPLRKEKNRYGKAENEKMPYYYPISNFRRKSSYAHSYPSFNTNAIVLSDKPPRKHDYAPNYYAQNVNNLPTKKVTPQLPIEQKKPNQPYVTIPDVKRKNLVQKPVPYPFTYIQYNLSSIPNPDFNENPWNYFNLRNKYYPHQQVAPYYSYLTRSPHVILVNPDLKKELPVIEQKPVEKKKVKSSIGTAKQKVENMLPKWQTVPLSDKVVDEVRANFVSKTKLLPFALRKKVKLERVGKVIKLEDFARRKREVHKALSESREEYEVFLEKSTCASDTEPGFFRMGNMTQPYPACCPQRIGVTDGTS